MMMKKKAMTNKQSGGLPVVPQGFKNGGKVKAYAGKESKAEEMKELKGYKNGGKVKKC
jgi:hypothetical protein